MIAETILDWRWHKALLAALVFVGVLAIALPGSVWWGSLIAAVMVTPPLMLLLCIPYALTILVLALSLSLLQASATALLRPSR